MSFRNPRVMLTVPKELNDILQRVADLQDIPKTRLIINCLEEFKEPLTVLASALELLKQKQDPSHLLMGMTANLLQNMGTEMSAYNEKIAQLNLKSHDMDVKDHGND